MRVAGRGYRDGVRNLEVMVDRVSEWWEQAGDTGRGESYGAEKFFV